MNFQKVTSRKFLVPSLGIMLGIANEAGSLGYDRMIVAAIIVASGLYAIAEAMVDSARLKAAKK